MSLLLLFNKHRLLVSGAGGRGGGPGRRVYDGYEPPRPSIPPPPERVEPKKKAPSRIKVLAPVREVTLAEGKKLALDALALGQKPIAKEDTGKVISFFDELEARAGTEKKKRDIRKDILRKDLEALDDEILLLLIED